MRLSQLDSLRGLAACTVVVCHATSILPGVFDQPEQMWWLTESPLALLRAGHAAVIFFFVLSGYVLALPFLKGTVSYPSFVVRRICRIWIPYVVIMTAAVFCADAFYPERIPALSHWANHSFEFPSRGLVANYLFMIGDFPSSAYNPVVWSLVYEMRISLIFPILVLVLRLVDWHRILAVAIGMSVTELFLERLPIWGGSGNVPMTLHYASLFVLGMLLAKETPRLREIYAGLGNYSKVFLWTLAIFCYGHPNWLLSGSRLQNVPSYRDGLTAVGVSLFIIFALSPSKFSQWLESRIPVFLGKISYSLYLCHAVILLSLVHTFYGRVPLIVIWLATVVLALAVSALSYRWIEMPSIRLGRALCMERRQPDRHPEPAGQVS